MDNDCWWIMMVDIDNNGKWGLMDNDNPIKVKTANQNFF